MMMYPLPPLTDLDDAASEEERPLAWFQQPCVSDALEAGGFCTLYEWHFSEEEERHLEHYQEALLQWLNSQEASEVQYELAWQGDPFVGETLGWLEVRFVLSLRGSCLNEALQHWQQAAYGWLPTAPLGVLPLERPLRCLDWMLPAFPPLRGPQLGEASLEGLNPEGVHHAFLAGLKALSPSASRPCVASVAGFSMSEHGSVSPLVLLGWLPRLAGATHLLAPQSFRQRLEALGTPWQSVAEVLQRPCLGLGTTQAIQSL